MSTPKGSGELLLLSYFSEPEPAAAENLLGEFLSRYARPSIQSKVRFKAGALARHDVEDICSEALLRVMSRLRKEKSGEAGRIEDWRAYVATVAYRACDDYFRVVLGSGGISIPIEGVPEPAAAAGRSLSSWEQGFETLTRTVWNEFRKLPLNQRRAWLIKDPDVIAIFVATGAASLREQADMLELPFQEFTSLWNRLPLGDDEIASMFGLTRMQWINRRSAARKRLARRLPEVRDLLK